MSSDESWFAVQLEDAELAALEADLLARFASLAAAQQSLLDQPERFLEVDEATRRWLAEELDGHIAWTKRLLEELKQ